MSTPEIIWPSDVIELIAERFAMKAEDVRNLTLTQAAALLDYLTEESEGTS